MLMTSRLRRRGDEKGIAMPDRLQHVAERFPKSTFRNVDLGESEFIDVNLRGARFENVGFTGATLRNVCLSDVTIEDASLEGMRIEGVLVTELLRAYRQRAE